MKLLINIYICNEEELKYIDETLSNELGERYLYKNKKYNIDSLITETYNKFHPCNDELMSNNNTNSLVSICNNEEKSIEELRKEYLEELNLNNIDSKINVFFDNFDRNIEDKINIALYKSKYLEENKQIRIKKYINIINSAYIEYINGNSINKYNYYIDIYRMENYFKYISQSNYKEKVIEIIATDIVEKEILDFKNLEILKNNINKQGEKDSINKSLDNLLGQVLLDLVNS